MFKHQYHQKIHHILNSLNTPIFEKAGAYFGGGTLITLLHNEYRWSKDVDFLCPVGPGYRFLREFVSEGNRNPSMFFTDTPLLTFPRELTANQYGIRFLVMIEETPIKFKIVAEARIKLDPPERYNWAPVPCLSLSDRYSEKLLANADRWYDASVESRDLIDLAILRLKDKIPPAAVDKAENAYPVVSPLRKSLAKFNGSRYREKCFSALQIANPEPVMEGIKLLEEDLI